AHGGARAAPCQVIEASRAAPEGRRVGDVGARLTRVQGNEGAPVTRATAAALADEERQLLRQRAVLAQPLGVDGVERTIQAAVGGLLLDDRDAVAPRAGQVLAHL